MKIVILLFVSGFIMLATAAYSQTTIHFCYDNAGNRISRSIELKKSTAAEADSLKIIPLSDQKDQIKIKIYPNPTKGLITVTIAHLPENVPASLAIYNIEGKNLKYIDVYQLSNQFDISSFPDGFYILIVTAGIKKTEWKIVKK